LLNYSEKSLEIRIKKVLLDSNRRIFSSVAMGDVLDLKRTDLLKEEFDLALKTSFDFIITDSDTTPLLAIEFDGPIHQKSTKRLIDKTKNSICEKYNFPILRIDFDLLNTKIGNYDIVEWLVEIHLIYDEFCKLQELGKISPDEPFYFGSLINFDPFIKSRAQIQHMAQQGIIKSRMPYSIISAPGNNYYCACTAIEITDNCWIYGEAKCRIFLFPAISPSELSEELSFVAAADSLEKRIFGMDTDILTTEELLQKRKQLETIIVKEIGHIL